MIKNIFTLFLILIVMVSCQQKSDVTLYYNVKGYTFAEDELKEFNTLAFRDNMVLGTGSEDDLRSEYPAAQMINGEGNVMLPGLIDAHGHVMGLGYQQMNANVTGLSSLEETLDKVKKYARTYPEVQWIEGRGWNHTHWEINRFPTSTDLDKAVSDKPVWLRRVDGHAGWANSAAMEIAGITSDTEAPDGGKIIRDDNGNPTGVFIDAAMQLIEKHIPEPTEEEKQKALEMALERTKSVGLTGTHDAGIGPDTWELYKKIADKDKLTMRIYAMIGGGGSTFDELARKGPVESYGDEMLSLRSVKLYADGALGSRGAAMLEDYSDDAGNKGLLFKTEEEFEKTIHKTASAGFQTNVHAIGDRANRVVLNAFETVNEQLKDPGNSLRHRIEHAQIVAPEDIPRFKELNIIASMQPTHATSDMNMAGDRIGSERLEGAYAWQTFLEQGTVVASGSDYPVESANPFWGLYSAVTRQNHDGQPPEGWRTEEAMNRKQALKSFTVDAAYAGFNEDITGSLEEGKRADFILIDRDYFTVPESEIYQTNILETWVDGRKVYDEADQ